MGLLEKAGQISTDDSPSATPEKPQAKAPEAQRVSPAPVAAQPAPGKAPAKEKKSRRRARKAREPREKKVRMPKVLPEGSEEASRSQRVIRRGSDFIVSYGWAVPVVALSAYGTYFDPTYIFLLGILLMGFNLGFMPYTTGRTVGNWISRTTYINTKSGVPHQSYVFLKGLTMPMVLLGIILFLTSTSEGFGSTTGQITLVTSLVFLLPPTLDYLFYRFKRDDLGLWDTLYGGVWMVKTQKSAESKGWLKRLEQLGDYSEAQGWWSDDDSKEDPGKQ
mgnify:CR=1 FL=1